MTTQTADVAVVGAGLSGLACAVRLQQAGFNVQLLEAASRVGGRIHSCRLSTDNSYLGDLGPSWCWPDYQPVVANWLDRLGVQLLPQFIEGMAVVERDQQQAVSHHNLPSQHGISRLAGGPQALIDTLVEQLGPQRLSLNRAVDSITATASDLRLFGSEKICLITAKQVVLALPLRLIAQNFHFEPPLPAARVALMQRAPTWMAAQAKVVVQYAQPFWRERGLSGRVASQVGPLVEVHDHSGADGQPAALFGFVGIPADLRAANRQALESAIVAQLVHCFGQQAGQPVSMHLQDWALDPLICADADRRGPASHPDVLPAAVRQPEWQRRLHFAVAETSTRSPGLLEGALHAADTAVEAIISSRAD